MKHIHVVAGIIYSPDQQQILIAKRPDHLHQGGLWEFPGGKVDQDESPEAALIRELEEELAIRAEACNPFRQISHRYPDKAVMLDFWQVSSFSGEPRGQEGQQVRWIALAELAEYPFPAANTPIVEALLNGE